MSRKPLNARTWFVVSNPQGVMIPQTSSNSRRGAIANLMLAGGNWPSMEAEGYSVGKIGIQTSNETDALLSHIAALQAIADAGAEALRVVAHIETHVRDIGALTVCHINSVGWVVLSRMMDRHECPTLAAALAAAVKAKGANHVE